MQEILKNPNVWGILVSFAYVFAILFLARLLERFGKEASRKAVHILVSNWWLLAMLFFDSPVWAAIVPACFVVLNYLSYRLNLFTAMERGAGKGDLGTVYYAISLLVLALLTFGPGRSPIVGGIGILIMGYGDGLAAVIGTRWPLGRYRLLGAGRSLSGSSAMFLASFIVALLLLQGIGHPAALTAAFALAALATLLEAATPVGLDNLTVPLLTSGAYYWLFAWHPV